MYAPQLGRFISRDPDPSIDGVNPYDALNDNPTRFVDPMGMDATQPPTTSTTQPTTTSATQPSTVYDPQTDPNARTPQTVLSDLQVGGINFAVQDAKWVPFKNECADQASGLYNYLLKKYGDKTGDIPFWIPTLVARRSGPFHHSVLLLKPKKGNPMPPMILDPFHSPFTGSTRNCVCETYAQFKKDYPSPGDFQEP